ncbi:hypothetical protein V8C86DRAFT_2518875 [Haematococcus lacustris]
MLRLLELVVAAGLRVQAWLPEEAWLAWLGVGCPVPSTAAGSEGGSSPGRRGAGEPVGVSACLRRLAGGRGSAVRSMGCTLARAADSADLWLPDPEWLRSGCWP